MTMTAERQVAPSFDLSTLAPSAELRALNCTQMRDRCRNLARAGRSEYEIVALTGWNVAMVRRALSSKA